MAIAALQQILAWGVSEIHAVISSLTAKIAELASEEGYTVLRPEQRCAPRAGTLRGTRPGRRPRTGRLAPRRRGDHRQEKSNRRRLITQTSKQKTSAMPRTQFRGFRIPLSRPRILCLA